MNLVNKAEDGYQKASKAEEEAIKNLGKVVFDSEKDNENSPYAENIKIIRDSYEKRKLWQLYRLEIDGNTQCDSCSAIITADSMFCNKCGSKVQQRDYSLIGITDTDNKPENSSEKACCPNCGWTLLKGASFCEKCGTRI